MYQKRSERKEVKESEKKKKWKKKKAKEKEVKKKKSEGVEHPRHSACELNWFKLAAGLGHKT